MDNESYEKCPLLLMGKYKYGKSADCREDACAWYDKYREQCALLSISQSCSALAKVMRNGK